MIVGMISQNIGITAISIGELLKKRRLQVPPSQRSYRWKTEHVEDLLKDIRSAIEDDADDYFLGSIVSISSKGRTWIYDGQQRLAATMILIAAIRNELLAIGSEEDAKTAESDFLFSKRRGEAEAEPHLTLNLADRDFFSTRILPRPHPETKRVQATRMRDSYKRMESAAKYAKTFIADNLVKDRSPRDADKLLNKWLDFIEKSLQVIWVQVVDERTAFTIFETMNDRGLKLSASDLLKNYLHATAEEKHDEIVHKWSSMTSILETVEGEEENIVEYIRCFWVSRYGHTRTRYLYDRIKEKTTNKSKALNLVTELEDSAQNYAAIISASHERITDRGAEVSGNIETLRTLGVTQLRPMLLSAFVKFTHGQFAKLLEMSVAWSVRFIVTGTPSGTIEGYYAKISVGIWEDKITTADGAVTEIKQILPKDEVFKTDFANLEESKAKIARYYLSALQKTKDGTTPARTLTLEHIMQVERDINGTISEEDHKSYLNRIGNLALIKYNDNGAMQGVDFDAKKLILASEDAPSLTKDIATLPEWGLDEIIKRQIYLAELAVRTWPVS